MVHPHDDATGRRSPVQPSTPSAAVLTPPTGLPPVRPQAPSVPQQRTPSEPAAPAGPVPPPPAADPGLRLCTCGHPEDMHEHYRPGTDCGACGARSCGEFRVEAGPANPLRRLLRRRSR